MKQLETGLIEWFVARLDDGDPIRQQLRSAEISAREFTSGGGAFLSLRLSSVQPSSSNGEPTILMAQRFSHPSWLQAPWSLCTSQAELQIRLRSGATRETTRSIAIRLSSIS